MQRSKLGIWRVLGIGLLLGTIYVMYSCGFQEKQYARVRPVEEICNCIKHIKKEISTKLYQNHYEKKSKDSSNINLSKNSIKDRTVSSWYKEVYVNERGTFFTLTYSVESGALWLVIEINGKDGEDLVEEYEMAISFYKEYTYGNIARNRIYKMIANNKAKIGEDRIDSWNFPDVFVYKVNEKTSSCNFHLAGIVN